MARLHALHLSDLHIVLHIAVGREWALIETLTTRTLHFSAFDSAIASFQAVPVVFDSIGKRVDVVGVRIPWYSDTAAGGSYVFTELWWEAESGRQRVLVVMLNSTAVTEKQLS